MRRFNKCGLGYATMLNDRFTDEHPEDSPDFVSLLKTGVLVRSKYALDPGADTARSIDRPSVC